ncbi:hypothetical protein LHYA1_G001098 [Lachnellula hyalina]|uniref:Uncharacterized protein n=1 Tax=Lachnellula hyalina TaxID=1316788 RepID=A0A8H8R827_9HELO|nr:uncharacterized protein LHYA1_G001098 [Lachnellula hyalina]TVY30140.1 hypothetical protein LHYA1_G001098 [Lachnellula hyalina]
MGSCTSRLRAELVAPPPRGNTKILYPQRPEPYLTRKEVQKQSHAQSQSQSSPRNENGNQSGNGAKLVRRETPSGIPGLTYDHAGRPVWREEIAHRSRSRIRIEHQESV